MKKFNYIVRDELGIHARPAGMFVKKAAEFKSTVEVLAKGKTVNAKSIMGIMSLGLGQGDELTVVDDQHGSPTSTTTLCKIIEGIMEKEPEYGVYHSTNEGFTTWCDFTRKIFELANITTPVRGITSAEYKEMFPMSSDRPTNSQLSKEKLHSIDINPERWEDALAKYLKEELK